MSTNILFVFEGERAEKVIAESLEKSVFKDEKIIKCAFAADIYQLYATFVTDEYLDMFSYIKALNEQNAKVLYSLPEELVSQFVIFEKQIEKYIGQPCPKVAVLSAFPLFVFDYFGCKEIIRRLT